MGEEPTPERPRDAGVPEDYPASTSAIEGAHVLANEARERLHADGFNDDQIDLWAETFMNEVGAGSVESFVAWIRTQEDRRPGS
jgi:hypothetical protein